MGPWGRNVGQPTTIQEIYGTTEKNPRLTLHIPDNCGSPIVIGAQAPVVTPGIPVMTAPPPADYIRGAAAVQTATADLFKACPSARTNPEAG